MQPMRMVYATDFGVNWGLAQSRTAKPLLSTCRYLCDLWGHYLMRFDVLFASNPCRTSHWQVRLKQIGALCLYWISGWSGRQIYWMFKCSWSLRPSGWLGRRWESAAPVSFLHSIGRSLEWWDPLPWSRNQSSYQLKKPDTWEGEMRTRSSCVQSGTSNQIPHLSQLFGF